MTLSFILTYILSAFFCCVDDIMVIEHEARPIMDMVDKYIDLKESSVGGPYLLFECAKPSLGK